MLLIGWTAWYVVFKKDKELNMKNVEMLSSEGIDIHTESVAYFGTTTGFYAEPVEAGEYPGVVMIHEWWGLNDNIKQMAEALAKEGYRVLAVDLFGKVATTREEASAQIGSLNQAVALENLKAAAQFLRDKKATKLASLGWCFGGGQSLKLGLSGEALDALVIYYGQLSTSSDELKAVKAPVLGIFGETDASIPPETVRAFESVLGSLGIEKEIYTYSGVGHAFANPSGQNFAPEETKDAWEKTLAFLKKHL